MKEIVDFVGLKNDHVLFGWIRGSSYINFRGISRKGFLIDPTIEKSKKETYLFCILYKYSTISKYFNSW